MSSETFDRIRKINTWNAPKDWLRIRTIDMHTGGEPLRVIVDGFPDIQGSTILEKRNYVKHNYDHLRTALMFEPRGHADMYGCLLTSPQSAEADFGIIFMHNEGYSTMCGHATIAITKLAVEMGWVKVQEPETIVKIDAPCGLLTSYAEVENGKVKNIRFHNVPSFVVALDREVEVDGLGIVKYDLAYGGAFYAYVDANPLNIQCTPENYRTLIERGMDIKRAVMTTSDLIIHPFEKDLSFLYGTIFIGGPVSNDVDSRNVCIFAEGEVDRSPTGSGVSGRAAIHYKRGDIGVDEPMTIESILGSRFKTRVVKETRYGDFDAVIPEVEGDAHITGQNEFVIDPSDPLKEGFILR
ncbi:proline racemase family protein [Fulvivirgaceae bacterium BMA10]|uniref:Proline racemase family protein n=1 Tax=Splendidivirga corallicola TaxID=3051826 RepID=A0ABT8KK21_9BACT|nr:proline racemase family protein [Fulvivirgaceae bacterium BMA10]